MTSKRSRSALITALAVGACGLVAVPAASAADTQYFVQSPVVTGVSDLTPESAVLHGSVDTGGNPAVAFTALAGADFAWTGGVNIINSGSSNATDFIEGLPASGSSSTVWIGSKSFSNAGADNYSNVEFELDPVSDYVANGGTPGSGVIFGTSMEIGTGPGLTSVTSSVGAFGAAAQSNSTQTPLKPGTKYYYWIVDQPGTTDNAEDVNVGTAASPSYSCYPMGYIAQYLPAAPVQGPCVYQFGNANGVDFYQSPNGVFTTPRLGEIAVGANAMVSGNQAMVHLANRSGYAARMRLKLTIGGKAIASARVKLRPHADRTLALTLTGAGAQAATRHASARIVVTANNFGQALGRKTITLRG